MPLGVFTAEKILIKLFFDQGGKYHQGASDCVNGEGVREACWEKSGPFVKQHNHKNAHGEGKQRRMRAQLDKM